MPAAFKPLAFALFLAIAFGCDAPSNAPHSGDAQTKSVPVTGTSEEKSPLGDSPEIQLIEGDRETLAKILADHHGKVVLVDFWATWCGPCVKQFPHSIELSRKHRDGGLAVVSVSMNEPKERESVLTFLRRQKADIENLLPIYGAGSEFLEAFDLRGDVPFYKLYDRQGQLRYTFSDNPEGIDLCEPIEKIDQRVVELLELQP